MILSQETPGVDHRGFYPGDSSRIAALRRPPTLSVTRPGSQHDAASGRQAGLSYGIERSGMPVSLKTVLSNWAALVALWAPAYLVLLEYTDFASAHSQPLQWSLVAIGASGLASVVYAAW